MNFLLLALWCRIFYYFFFAYFFSSLNLDWVAVFAWRGGWIFQTKKLIFNRSINQHLFILHVKQCVETIIILAEFHSFFLALVSQLECLQETFVVIVINFFVIFFFSDSILSSI